MESQKVADAKVKAKQVLVADLQLVIASLMFGFGFVAQRGAMIDGLGPLTFNALRYVVSAVLMAVIIPGFNSRKQKVEDKERQSQSDLTALEARQPFVGSAPAAALKHRPAGGMALVLWAMQPINLASLLGVNTAHIFFASGGLCLANFGASTLGQLGITSISASASAFITGFYVVFTPVLMYILPQFNNQRPTFKTWLAVCGSMIGLFIISDSSFNDLKLGHGEILTLGSAFFWTMHIFVTEWAVTRHDAVDLTFYEMIFISILCTIVAFYYEEREWELHHLAQNWIAITAMGLMECVGFTLSALGQVHAPPTHVALILATEAVFATVGGYTFLGEVFTSRESVGCLLMMASMLLAKLDEEDDDKPKK